MDLNSVRGIDMLLLHKIIIYFHITYRIVKAAEFSAAVLFIVQKKEIAIAYSIT